MLCWKPISHKDIRNMAGGIPATLDAWPVMLEYVAPIITISRFFFFVCVCACVSLGINRHTVRE